MSSIALDTWRTMRSNRLDELFSAHEKIDPKPGPGRRVGTQQLNLALMVALAGEWQGFVRDLHDVAVDVFVSDVASRGSAAGADRLGILLTRMRRVDTGNADASALSDDFGRLGIVRLHDELDLRDHRGAGRREKLRRLMVARNGFAHGDRTKFAELQRIGVALDFDTVKSWRSALDGLAATPDGYVAEYLADLLDIEGPW